MQIEKLYKCRNCGKVTSILHKIDVDYSINVFDLCKMTEFLPNCKCNLKSTNGFQSWTIGDLIKINVGE